jgi:transaldolase
VLESIRTKIFADGADVETIARLAADPVVSGFTTNPTLMSKAGVTDYERFAHEVLAAIGAKPVSFEVFADDEGEIRRQAHKISAWGDNVYVKVPVTTTDGESTAPLVRELSEGGIKLNVTGLFTTAQVEMIAEALRDGAPSNISVFAGRIADAGIDPLEIMARSVEIIEATAERGELIWASPREVLNVVQASNIGCHIITVTPDLLAKLASLGKDLDRFSLETVQMFRRDAIASGFDL